MAAVTDERPRSETTARAVAFVAAHRDEAEALGRSLADDVHDPDAFARDLEAGFARLADPEYQEGEQRVAPGLGPVLGVRWPLNTRIAGSTSRTSIIELICMSAEAAAGLAPRAAARARARMQACATISPDTLRWERRPAPGDG